jgi:hypothetical protein
LPIKRVEVLLDRLFASKLAQRERIGNVPFEGEQIWFALEALAILNQQAPFVPHVEAAE